MDDRSGRELICFSHLRWDFVYQRPQHLMSRFAQSGRVFVIEEPIFHDGDASLNVSERGENLFIVVPHLTHGLEPERSEDLKRKMLDQFLVDKDVQDYVLWYYTPMMLAWSGHLRPAAVIYDCMDQLSAFKDAPPELMLREAELFAFADLVFTGGHSLYEAKKDHHPDVYAFPSSIDVPHFQQAIEITEEMLDQADIPHPRIGFVGVIDERLDIEMLGRMAELKPEWRFVMIGPVVKIDEASLPRPSNIHYLGSKSYDELPAYIAGWDVAMMPFALNDSTRYISPTKTPEYLAAGRPVVSTPIRDVVQPYGENGLVQIASTAEEFISAIEASMDEDGFERRQKAAEFMSGLSWNRTHQAMSDLVDNAVAANSKSRDIQRTSRAA